MTPSLRTRLAVWRMTARTHVFLLGAGYRVARAERMTAAGRRREAERVAAAVRRDLRREEARLARS